jgi:hypothetical protein
MLAGAPFLVSNWQAETRSAVDLMVATFAASTAEPKLSHGEALQKPMLAMIGNVEQPDDPKFWAHFESPLSSGQAHCNGPMPGSPSSYHSRSPVWPPDCDRANWEPEGGKA